jgi:hypothetical protein
MAIALLQLDRRAASKSGAAVRGRWREAGKSMFRFVRKCSRRAERIEAAAGWASARREGRQVLEMSHIVSVLTFTIRHRERKDWPGLNLARLNPILGCEVSGARAVCRWVYPTCHPECTHEGSRVPAGLGLIEIPRGVPLGMTGKLDCNSL